MSKRKSLGKEVSKSDVELKSISGKLVKERSVLKLKQDTVNDTYQSMEEIQNKIRSEQESRETLLEELKINELKIVEQEQRINIIKERIKDRYSMDIPLELIVDDELEDLELRVVFFFIFILNSHINWTYTINTSHNLINTKF